MFNENILSTYISLDQLIDNTSLSKKQRAVIELLMRGYTVQDIADECGVNQPKISMLFSRALDALTEQNNRRWLSVTKDSVRKM